MKWYQNNYRRHLLDMHIEDQNADFMQKFDPDEYYRLLEKSNVQCVMIYFVSHVGLCYYPSSCGKTHAAFVKEDKMKRLIENCRRGGINVVGYYSLIFNNREARVHPEWNMRDENGKTSMELGKRAGLLCPNNPDYREFVGEQIKEISNYAKLDGIFFDMPFFPMQCRCESCRKRYLAETGNVDMPKFDSHSEGIKEYVLTLQRWITDFCDFVAKKARKYLGENVSVEFNNAGVIACYWGAGSSEGISDLADYAGGDVYEDIYAQSFLCKYYYESTRNQPFEYMTSRCPVLQDHTLNKSEYTLKTELSIIRAHHGATLFIDAVDPDGGIDERVYERIGRLYAEQIPLEKYYKGDMLADVAVFFDSGIQFSSADYGFTNKICAMKAVKTLVERHVPVSVISNGHVGDLKRFKCVVLPALESYGNKEIEKFIDYAEQGGNLFVDSVSETRIIERLLNTRRGGFIGSDYLYVAPNKNSERLFEYFNGKYPMPVKYKIPVLEVEDDSEVMATVTLPATDPADSKNFASIHSNPPWERTEVPAVIRKKCGKGKIIWCAAALETEDNSVYGDVFKNLISSLIDDEYSVTTDASANVETVTFKDGDKYTVYLTSLSGDDKCVYPFTVSVKTQKPAVSVIDLETGEETDFEYKDGRVIIKGEMTLFRFYSIK